MALISTFILEWSSSLTRVGSHSHSSIWYLHNKPKLVRTALTDKCFLAMTQGAMHLGLGGNPFGGAGTGKTETVKALGAALGRHVMVFNCDESIDFASMGRILIGLTKSGAWACFDEFNRCKQDQLSAIAQLIQTIQLSMKKKRSKIMLLDKVITVDQHAAIFITLNPAGKAYLGRSVMPQTLKTLFRPIAMSYPNKRKIAEVILYSEGFLNSTKLGNCLVALFDLSSSFLSKQQHYDWGLRSLKTVLQTSAKLLRCRVESISLDDAKETEVVLRSILVNMLPRLTRSDSKLFLKLALDIFPDVSPTVVFSNDLKSSVLKTMKAPPFSMELESTQVDKVLQLHNILDKRIGCLILAPPGCAKSTIWKILREALIACGQPVIVHAFNPKAIPREKLLGSLDPNTREWRDGVLTKVARIAASQSASTRTWIICDGDIDPEWIENLNSVLDDNKVLTLPNGDRIPFGSNVNFVFETSDITFASPATVSRMGILHLSTDDFNPNTILTRWIELQPEKYRTDLKQWVQKFVDKALTYVLQITPVIETSVASRVFNVISQINMDECSDEAEFVRRIIRCFGASLLLEDRNRFLIHMRTLFGGVPDANYDKVEEHHNTLNDIVATRNTQRGLTILRSWVEREVHHLIILGPDGCGKESVLRHALPSSVQCVTIQCNRLTEPKDIVAILQQRCTLYSSFRGKAYRPFEVERLVLYIKDANISRQDKYGTSMLLAFLQQLLCYDGFFDEHLDFVHIQNVQIVLSLSPVLLEKHPLHPRIASAARLLVLDNPSKPELISICAFALRLHFSISSETLPIEINTEEGRKKVSEVMAEVLLEATEKYHVSASFNVIVAWAKSLSRYDCEKNGFLVCFEYDASQYVFDKIEDKQSKLRCQDFFRALMYQCWNYGYNTDHSRLFHSLRFKFEGNYSSDFDKMVTAPQEWLKQMIERGIIAYQREMGDLRLVVTSDFLHKFSSIDHALSTEESNIILCGKPGIGCREAIKLFCFLKDWKILSPCASSRGNAASEFRETLKAAIELAGSNDDNVCFCVEHYLLDESTLPTIDAVLSSGELPGMFDKDSNQMLNSLNDAMMEDGRYSSTRDFFAMRTKQNLHVCLLIDDTYANPFFSELENYPSILKSCVKVTMEDWSGQSLRESCNYLFSRFPSFHSDQCTAGADNNKGHAMDSVKRLAYLELATSIHESALALGATPRHFVKLFKTWDALYTSQNKTVQSAMIGLQKGLQKLAEARHAVAKLEKLVAVQQEEIRKAQKEANDAMEGISRALIETTASRQVNERLNIEMKHKSEEAVARKKSIQKELDGINPLLEEANQSVKGIKSDHLNEIRALKAPPAQISVVLSGVLLMLGIEVSLLDLSQRNHSFVSPDPVNVELRKHGLFLFNYSSFLNRTYPGCQ